MSENLKIYKNFIIRNQNYISWLSIFCNNHLTLELVSNNLNLPWVWSDIDKWPNLTAEFININLEKGTFKLDEINIDGILRNKNVNINNLNFDLIPFKEYYVESLINNPYITWSKLKEYNKKYEKYFCFEFQLNLEYQFTVEEIEENLEIELVPWICMSHCKNLTLDFIIEHNYLDWNLRGLVLRFENGPEITKLLEGCSDKDFIWGDIFSNKFVEVEDIEKFVKNINNPLILASFTSIWTNPNITYEFIKKYKNYIKNWYSVMNNPNITVEIIEEIINDSWIEELYPQEIYIF